jgi:hypothetical protein
VRNAQGQPIYQAKVAILFGVNTEPLRADTDLNGNFQIFNLPKGSWIMQIYAAGYQSEVRDINVADGMSALNFTLKPSAQTGNLVGKVYLAGTDRPIGGIKVALGTGANAFSDTSGNCRFNALPVGYYIILVSGAGYEPMRLPAVYVGPGDNNLDLPIAFASRGPTVYGQVYDATSGKPVRQATVGVESKAGLLVRSDISDYTGFYQMRDVPTGLQLFRISAPGYKTRTFTNDVDASRSMDLDLERGPDWWETRPSTANLPIAAVAQSSIYLTTMRNSAILDARPSVGSGLKYLWRENPDNPDLNLLPAGTTNMSTIQVSGFTKPGIYIFELRVQSANDLSPNTAAITVFAPGLAGNVHASPSDGVYGQNLAVVRVYTRYTDARDWLTTVDMVESSQTTDSGDFVLDNLAAGTYWVVARASTGAGFNQYGPVKRRVNYSSAVRKTAINLPRDEFTLSGIVTDALSKLPIEGVRVVVAPGSVSESFRTSTDGSGNYRLTAVPRGSQTLMLMKEGYLAISTDKSIGGDSTYAFELAPNTNGALANLMGYITADYQGIALPVPYAEIIIGSGMFRTLSDGDGRYEIPNMPPGLYFGTVRKPGYVTQKLADFGFVTVNAGSNRVDRSLTFDDHGPVMDWKGFNEKREPIPGVRIRVLPPIGPFLVSRLHRAGGPPTAIPTSDDAGVCQLVGVPHGERQLEITLPDGRVFTQKVNINGNLELLWSLPGDAYYAWKERTFTGADRDDSQVSGETMDPDHDGLPNLLEFAMGHNPLVANSFQGSTWVTLSHGAVRFGFQRAQDAASLSYILETRTNLLQGSWVESLLQSPTVRGLSNGLEAVEVTVPTTSQSSLYWRLKIRK